MDAKTISHAIATIVSLVSNLKVVLGILLGAILSFSYKHRQEKKIKKLLFITRQHHSCFVYIPKFRTIILNHERNVFLCDEVEQMVAISALLATAHIRVETECANREAYCNEIQIGGPVSNSFTNHYINLYLKQDAFEWVVTREHYARYRADPHLHNLDYSFIKLSDNGQEGFKICGKFYEYIPQQKGWAVLIKLICDKQDGAPRAIHLLFGCGAYGTIGAVDFFVKHYSSIYKRNKRKPYMGIFEVDGQGRRKEQVTWIETNQIFK